MAATLFLSYKTSCFRCDNKYINFFTYSSCWNPSFYSIIYLKFKNFPGLSDRPTGSETAPGKEQQHSRKEGTTVNETKKNATEKTAAETVISLPHPHCGGAHWHHRTADSCPGGCRSDAEDHGGRDRARHQPEPAHRGSADRMDHPVKPRPDRY